MSNVLRDLGRYDKATRSQELFEVEGKKLDDHPLHAASNPDAVVITGAAGTVFRVKVNAAGWRDLQAKSERNWPVRFRALTEEPEDIRIWIAARLNQKIADVPVDPAEYTPDQAREARKCPVSWQAIYAKLVAHEHSAGRVDELKLIATHPAEKPAEQAVAEDFKVALAEMTAAVRLLAAAQTRAREKKAVEE